jgi:hypothetical protein
MPSALTSLSALSSAPHAWLTLGRPGRLIAPTSPLSSMPMCGMEKNT